ncbi:WDR78 protein, partial [Piaya cayana]|nr:WDR78 protein [Piaya cayana]
LQVFDDEGKDVTPHPLFHSDPKDATPGQGKLLSSSACCGATGSGFLSFSMHEMGGVSTKQKRSCLLTLCNFSDVQVRQEEINEELTQDDLDRRVDIYLTETETIWMLDMPSVVVSVESEDAGRVQEQNRIYIEICKNRPGNDRFVENTVQTINRATKNKEVQCDEVIMEDKGRLSDHHIGKAQSRGATTGKSIISHATKEDDQTISVSSDRSNNFPGNISAVTTSVTILEGALLARIHKEEECHSVAILTSINFQQNLFFMKRILMENIFQPKLATYRQLPVLTDPDVTSDTSDKVAAVKETSQEEQDKEKEDKEEQKEAVIEPSVLSDLKETLEETVPPRLEQLWSYMCDLTHGHSVSSMTWNKVNPDLLAVGYRAFDFKEQKKGLACCWSLKNPMWPERIFWCKHGFTALDFSMASPNLLAVGMYNGSVAIYDVRSCNNTPLLESSASSNKHTGPILQLRWVVQDRSATGDGKKERLICISADSRVTEWLIQKRLDCTNLMKIKQTASEKKKLPGEKGKKPEAPISRQAAGMCFDFHPKDTNVYLTGTEEGHIHKCSCSCDEQFLQTYRGHKGPVYKVTWNPFSTDMFLSCSADWSIILWQQDSQMPILTFSSTTASVHDIMWSPKSVSIFAAANENRVEIWDLSVSSFHPVVSCFASPGVEFTSVLFANNTNCLLVGDSKGEVGAFELQNLAAHSSNKV